MENLFSQSQMDESNPWRRSGPENIHLDTAATKARKVPLTFLENQKEGSLPPPLQDSLPEASEAIYDFWSMSRDFIYRHHVDPRVKLYSPREESFPIPLSALTSPELFIRIWMLSKRNASMTIGLSMGQELCLIIRQVSLSLLYWKKPPDG